MPQVPLYKDTRVSPEPIPGVRVGEQVPLEALGGGSQVSQAFGAAGGLAEMGGRLTAQSRELELRERAEAMEQAARAVYADAEDAAAKMETKLSLEVQKVQGINSQGAADEAKAAFDSHLESILGSVKIPIVQERLRQSFAARSTSFNNGLQRYALGETRKWHDETDVAMRANEANAALLNPTKERLMAAKVRIAQNISNQAIRNGKSPEVAKALGDAEIAAFDQQVITRMLQNYRIQDAKEYLKDNNKSLGPLAGQYEKYILDAEEDSDAQAAARSIMAGVAPGEDKPKFMTDAEQREAARSLPERIRSRAGHYVSQFQSERNAEIAKIKGQFETLAYNDVLEGGVSWMEWSSKNRAVWDAMDPQFREFIKRESDRKLKGDDKKTDPYRRLAFLESARKLGGLQNMSDREFMLAEEYFDDGEYERLTYERAEAKAKGESASGSVSSTENSQIILEEAISQRTAGAVYGDTFSTIRKDKKEGLADLLREGSRELMLRKNALPPEKRKDPVEIQKLASKIVSSYRTSRVPAGTEWTLTDYPLKWWAAPVLGATGVAMSFTGIPTRRYISKPMAEYTETELEGLDLTAEVNKYPMAVKHLNEIAERSDSLREEFKGTPAGEIPAKIQNRMKRAFIEWNRQRTMAKSDVMDAVATQRIVAILEGRD